MCMISYIPGGVDIPVVGVRNGSVTNDDGHGWAVAQGGDLLTGKSMIFEEALEGFVEAREALGQGSVALFHSRFGTHGEMGEFNIHPFHFDEQSVMAHNGILPEKYHPRAGDRRSDTRVFVDQIGRFVDNPNGVPSRRGASVLGKRIGTYNKLVFLSTKSGQPKTRIVNAGAGIQVDGVWYSNTGYLMDYSWYKFTRRPMDQYDWREWEAEKKSGADCYTGVGKEVVVYEDDVCGECQSTDLDFELGMCNDCVSCLDCHDNFAYCMCWRPDSQRQAQGILTIGRRDDNVLL